MIRPVTRREAGWLLFDAPLPKGAPMLRDIEVVAATLMGLNATLSLGCKYALVGVSDLRVRAEQPETEPAETHATARMTEVEAGFVFAAHQLRAGATAKSPPVNTSNDTPAPDVASLCRETGWPFEERPDGSLVVDLGVSGAYVPAFVTARAAGIAVGATLVEELPDPGARRVALAVFLLRANGAFRMARAVFRSTEDVAQAVLEASLPADASSVELGMALGAVAVAAQHCALEAQLLTEDDRLACAYSNCFRSKEHPAPTSTTESPVQVQA